MAQEAIEQECKKRGYACKVETQGGMGIENELDEDEIAEADAVILAIAIGIEGEERFEEKEEAGKIIKIDPSVVIRDCLLYTSDPASDFVECSCCGTCCFTGMGAEPYHQ